MSEQYYYLLDGQEHGPFSRAAIESLLASGKLVGAFLRADKDLPWQAPEEMGLATPDGTKAHPSPLKTSDPATVVFRSRREIEQARSGGNAGPMLAAALFAVLIGGGVWLYSSGLGGVGELTKQISDLIPPSVAQGSTSIPSLADLSSGKWAARTSGGIIEIQDGFYLLPPSSSTPTSNQYGSMLLQGSDGQEFAMDSQTARLQMEMEAYQGDECYLAKFRGVLYTNAIPWAGVEAERSAAGGIKRIGICLASTEYPNDNPGIAKGDLYQLVSYGDDESGGRIKITEMRSLASAREVSYNYSEPCATCAGGTRSVKSKVYAYTDEEGRRIYSSTPPRDAE